MEKYQLIFSGERCGAFAKLPIREHLNLLKLSNSACEKISSGSKVVLKSGLDEAAMQKQKALFIKYGLVTKHRLTLSPEDFYAGLVTLDDINKTEDSLVVFLQKENRPAQIISRPTETELHTSKGKDYISIRYLNYQIGFMPLMILAAAVSLQLQAPVIVTIQLITGYDMLATVCGIAFLLASVLALPRLFQPLQLTKIIKGRSQIELVDRASLIVGKSTLDWQSADNNGSFEIAPTKASAKSERPLYSWNAHHRIEDSGNAAIDDIHSAITQGTVIEIAESLWKRLESILKRRSSRDKISNIDWDSEPASAVFDAKKKVVALIYRDNQTAYKIVSTELNEDIILHAFCLSIHKGGRV